MTNLVFHFLGIPSVEYNGQSIKFATRKTLALLAYLIVEGNIQPREALAALFWPDNSPEQGRALLRNTLRYLRQALHEAGVEAEPEHLLVNPNYLGFRLCADCELDLKLLQLAAEAAGQPQQQASELRRRLETAVALYRGEFLSGLSLEDAPDFEDWLRAQRQVCQTWLEQALDRLSDLYSAEGASSQAFETVTRWLALNPTNESAYRRLMQFHFAAGDRTAALQVYETCRSVLAAQLNTPPLPETTALAERIRKAVTSAPAQPLPAPAPTADLRPPMVGREKEHRQLAEAFRAASQGQVKIVTIEGESGIGKTRLVMEFMRWAITQGADTLAGRAFETGGELPYQPLVEALRPRLEQENAPDDLLGDVWLAELSRILPELRERYPDMPMPLTLNETEARSRLFESVARLVQAFTRQAGRKQRTVVLFLDDFQWADNASQDLLRYLLRRWVELKLPLLVLLTIRSDSLASSPALAAWLSGLSRELTLTRLALKTITLEDTTHLLQSLFESDSSGSAQEAASNSPTGLPAFARWLFSETQGQPFFLLETVKTLLEQGLLKDKRGHLDFETAAPGVPLEPALLSGLLPAGVRELVMARLSRLDSAASNFLIAAAVLDRSATFERICQVADLSESAGLEALDQVINGQVLAEGKSEQGYAFGEPAYYFTHEKFRTVVYSEAGEARRRIFHRRALAALEAKSKQQASQAVPAAELAYHAQAGGLPAAAFRYSLAAGEEALHLFALQAAIKHYELARLLLNNQQVAPENEEYRQLYDKLGRCYELVHNAEAAEAVYQELLSHAREHRQPNLQSLALNRLATYHAQYGMKFDEAASLLTQAVKMAEESEDRVILAETEWNLAQLNFYSSKYAPALEHGRRALELARQVNAPEIVGRSLNVLGYITMTFGHWQECESFAAEAEALYARLGNLALQADSLGIVAVAQLNQGRAGEAITSARKATGLAREIENRWGQAFALFILSAGLTDGGDYEEALKAAREVVALVGEQQASILAGGLIMLGNAQRALGLLEAAIASHLEGLKVCEEYRLRPFSELCASALCADYALSGDWTEAGRYAQQALNLRDYSFFYNGGYTRWLETEALLRAGLVHEAQIDLQRFEESIGQNRRHRIPYLRGMAALSLHQSATGQALSYLEEALRLALELKLPGEIWPLQNALAGLYAAGGQQEASRNASDQGRAVINTLAERINDPALRQGFLEFATLHGSIEY
ncbi:MAG TPA: AAA family ATPase [Chloroflexia bacterium]|nr:AAA family ATPase [Chloroflexia bacterium]